MKTSTKELSIKTIIVPLIIACLLITSSVSRGQQADKWNDNSDDLPGFGSDTVWIIVGTAAVVGVAAWLIFFNGSDESDKPKSMKTSDQKKIDMKDTTSVKDSASNRSSDKTLIKKNETEIESIK